MMKMVLGEYLRRYRCQERITAQELAKRLNVHASHISFIENGWANKCTFRNFAKIVVLLKLAPDEVYDIVMSFYESEVKEDAEHNCQ